MSDKNKKVFKCVELKNSYIINLRWDNRNLLFNSKKPVSSHCEEWFYVPKPLKKVEKVITERINKRWELKGDELSKETLLNANLKRVYDSHEEIPEKFDAFYEFKYDENKKYEEILFSLSISTKLKSIDPYEETSCEKYIRTSFSEKISEICDLKDSVYAIETRALLPKPLRHMGACSIKSSDLYNIIRAHVHKNLDNSVARISSDYRFCFSVKKLIKNRDAFTVFEMTHKGDRYGGGTLLLVIYGQGINRN